MKTSSYITAAKRLRMLADKLEQYASATTPQEKRLRTLTVNIIARRARELFEKNAKVGRNGPAPLP